jgi:hypothetical protein
MFVVIPTNICPFLSSQRTLQNFIFFPSLLVGRLVIANTYIYLFIYLFIIRSNINNFTSEYFIIFKKLLCNIAYKSSFIFIKNVKKIVYLIFYWLFIRLLNFTPHVEREKEREK